MLKLNNPFSNEPALQTILEKETLASKNNTEPKNSIVLDNVTKIYPMGRRTYQALGGVSLTIEPGEFVAIVGPSGSGKSTILNLMTGIDRPSAGTISIGGKSLGK